MKSFFTLLIISWLLTAINAGAANSIYGKVVSVADGDTITILSNNNQQTKIRLYGIDTPEKAQAFGQKAKKFTASLIAGKRATVKVYDTDRYGRSVGVVFVNGTNVNEELINNGLAWQYRKYCKASFCEDWLKREEYARSFFFGLWAESNPQPPWDWRKSRQGQSTKRSYAIPTTAAIASGTGRYHGNRRSHVFHAPNCQHYNCKNCTKRFKSIAEATNAGYRSHNQCVR